MQVVDKSGGRRTILAHLGSAHDEAELAALMEIGRARLAPGQQSLDLESLASPAEAGPVALAGRRRCELLWEVLTSAWRDLGLDEAVGGDEGFKQMVLARLVEPTSKADTIRVISELGVEAVSIRTLFRSLARCQERGWRAAIQAALHSHVTRLGDLSLLLYDVTTLYFEAEREDGLRRVGFSKERRVDPQVIVGMLTDRTGFPLQVGCWEGNKAETRTIIPMVQGFLDAHQVDASEVVVVADAGMLSADNLAALDEAGLGFIVGSKTTKAPWDLAEHIETFGNGFTDGQVIEARTPRRRRAPARTKNNDGGSRRFVPPPWNPQDDPRTWRVVWHYSAKRFARDNAALTAQRNKALAVVAGEASARRPRFVKGSKADLAVDEDAYQRAYNAAGLRGYITNLTARRMSADEVVSSYRALWHIEQTWRMSKHDLRARPVFHHQVDSIEAHLTMVMASLALARHLQDATGMSIKKIIHALKPLQSVEVTIVGHTITAQPQLTPEATEIITSIGLPGH